jgi:hypothetical protein
VSPLFDVKDLSAYADDTYIPRWKCSLEQLIKDVEKSLEAISKWLRDSGLKVKLAKTELVYFINTMWRQYA